MLMNSPLQSEIRKADQIFGALSKQHKYKCCSIDSGEYKVDQLEYVIEIYKKAHQNVKISDSYLQLYTIYKQQKRLDAGINALKEKLKYDAPHQLNRTYQLIINGYEELGNFHQAGQYAFTLATVLEEQKSYSQAMQFYKSSNSFYQKASSSIDQVLIRKNRVMIAYLNFKIQKYQDAAKDFEKSALELLPFQKLRDSCMKYIVYSFMSIYLTGDKVYIEEIPLKFDLLFSSIVDSYEAQKSFIYQWSQGQISIPQLLEIDEIYKEDDHWVLMLAQFAKALSPSDQLRISTAQEQNKPKQEEVIKNDITIDECDE